MYRKLGACCWVLGYGVGLWGFGSPSRKIRRSYTLVDCLHVFFNVTKSTFVLGKLIVVSIDKEKFSLVLHMICPNWSILKLVSIYLLVWSYSLISGHTTSYVNMTPLLTTLRHFGLTNTTLSRHSIWDWQRSFWQMTFFGILQYMSLRLHWRGILVAYFAAWITPITLLNICNKIKIPQFLTTQ